MPSPTCLNSVLSPPSSVLRKAGTLGARLKRLREARGMTQAGLAEAAGVPFGSLLPED